MTCDHSILAVSTTPLVILNKSSWYGVSKRAAGVLDVRVPPVVAVAEVTLPWMCGGGQPVTPHTSLGPRQTPRGCSGRLLSGFTKGGARLGCSWMRRRVLLRPPPTRWMLASSGQVESDKKREGDGSLAEPTSILQKTHVCQAVFSWVKFENLATVSLSFLFGN